MSTAILNIFILTCIYGIISGLFLDMVSWKIIDYKREQRRRAHTDKSKDKRGKELPLHCKSERSRKRARLLLPILSLLLCGAGGGILALNETLTLPARVILAIMFCLLVSIALVSSWIDVLIRIIPNEIVLTVAALGLIYRIASAIADPWSLLGGLASFALTLGMFSLASFIGRKRWSSRGVGLGDLKLALVASFIVGFPGIVYFYIALCITMLVYFVYMIARGSFGFFVWFPMCSFLMIALLVGLVYSYIPGMPLLT